MVEFGGWMLPVQYSGIKDEHHAVRTKAGLFDVSHMGEVTVQGQDALAFVQKLITNDASKLADNQILYTTMCYANGGTVDDLLVYRKSVDSYMLVINAANIDKDWAWMQENVGDFKVDCQNISDDMALLALQGPSAQAILAQLTDADLDGLKYYWFKEGVNVSGRSVLLSRTGYTGEDGFEIYCKPADIGHLWAEIMSKGQPMGLLPAGLGCRDTLRFEACLPLYGHELAADISPLEVGLGFCVKLDKGEFNGREVLAAQKADGVKRRVAGFEMLERGIARGEYPVLADGKVIGKVTTGTYAPTVDKNLGLALIEAGYAKVGQKIEIEIRGKGVAAQVIAKPFYKREGK